MASKVQTARRLRGHQTDAERVIWFPVRNRRLNGWTFRRQMPRDGLVVDVCCPDAKLEFDGGQQTDHHEQDLRHTESFEQNGYPVLRFRNNDVLQNLEGVLEEILNTVPQHAPEPPHATPLPVGEREQA